MPWKIPWLSRRQKLPYDFRNDILNMIKANTMYVKSSILFWESNYGSYGNYLIQFSTNFEGNGMSLKMNIKCDDIVLDVHEEKDECIICTEDTDTTIKCCKKPICVNCIEKIKETSNNFSCPHCRRTSDTHKTVTLHNPDFDFFFDDDISKNDKLIRVGEIISQ